MAVNDIPKSLAPKLPPTDSRHRKDLRLLEQGDNAQVSQHFEVAPSDLAS